MDKQDRELLINVIVYHYRASISHCGCGWNELGRSHSEHVVEVFELSLLLRN